MCVYNDFFSGCICNGEVHAAANDKDDDEDDDDDDDNNGDNDEIMKSNDHVKSSHNRRKQNTCNMIITFEKFCYAIEKPAKGNNTRNKKSPLVLSVP